MANRDGSRSMNIAPVSSRKLDILPFSNAVKNVSGIQSNVWRDVENLQSKFHINTLIQTQKQRNLRILPLATHIQINQITRTTWSTKVGHCCFFSWRNLGSLSGASHYSFLFTDDSLTAYCSFAAVWLWFTTSSQYFFNFLFFLFRVWRNFLKYLTNA